jgi:hypothetical protein
MSLTEKEISSLAQKGYLDPVFFCGFFLPKWFPGVLPREGKEFLVTSMPVVHRGILAVLTKKCAFLERYGEVDWLIENFVWQEDPNDSNSPIHHIFYRDEEGTLKMRLGKFTLLLMPRGFSKTTLLNASNLYHILYRDAKFPFYLSKTAGHATKQMSSVTRQLKSNPKVLSVFGSVKPDQRNEEGLKWSESDGFIQTTTGISMGAQGSGGQVRGMLDDGQRPDRLVIDDLEDQESTRTTERRSNTMDWFLSDLLPVLPEMDENATAIMLSNLVHSDCLAVKLMSDPEWTVVKIGALDKAGEPIWPALMDKAKLDRRKQSYAIKGKLSLFYLEFMNEVRVLENAKFKPEFIHINPLGLDEVVQKAIAIDPAISPKKKSDFCAFAVVGMTSNGIIQVFHTQGKIGMTPREQIDTYFDLHFKYELGASDKHGVESNAYQAALVHLIREEMFRKAKDHGAKAYFEVTPITHSSAEGNKEERVEGIIQPRYAAGYVHHQRHFPQLETQLQDWPNGKRDFPDVVAMAVSLLDEVAACGLGDSKVLTEDEYEPLSMVLGGKDWRRTH